MAADSVNDGHDGVRRGHSCAADPQQAVRELHAALAQPDLALVLFFCSSDYELHALGAELNRLFPGVPVAGCTTAGEIGPAGCLDRSLCGVSFARGEFVATVGRIGGLRQFDAGAGHAFAQAQLQKLESLAPQARPENSFALLLIDGLSVREEPVTRALQEGLGRLPLIGGSAGDDLRLIRTHVFCDGGFHADSAVMILVTTPRPFKGFKIQHFTPTAQWLVVTQADTARRIVMEINGRPAAQEYARLADVHARELGRHRATPRQPSTRSAGGTGTPVPGARLLSARDFAASPVVVLIDGSNYVRSIQKVNDDGSLTFYCAIDEGVVLRLARGLDLVGNMEQSLAALQADIGPPQLLLVFDCVLRKLEIQQDQLKDRVVDVLRRYHAVGFNTYGEQFCGVHVNQTLAGVAIGAMPRALGHG
jgi:hypothetical protein